MACDDEKGFSAGAILTSFFVGGLVGASLAILLTPKSGEEMRERIRDLANSARDKAMDMGSGFKEDAATLVDKGKDYLDQRKQIISSAIQAGKAAMDREKAKLSAEEEVLAE